ncbi:MAG: molybdenum ABC transporter ATP-binding protein [Chloroflexi bacterium]|nr:molybdenum ABC transporter ATP-binding protein [Chloroflexota bacterium]
MISLDLAISRGDFQLALKATLDGGISAIFGPSGSGKSTTLACIAGLINPDSGSIKLDEESLFDSAARMIVPPEKRSVGLVFQDGALFPHLDVRGNIEFGAKFGTVSDRKVPPDQLMMLLDIHDLAERNIADLSGGERQRVALARSLAAGPRVLLLDEPVASLDARLRTTVLGYLKEIHRELGIPMVYVSHNVSEVIYLAEQVIVLDRGAVVAEGAPRSVLLGQGIGQPANFEDVENYLSGTLIERGSGGRSALVKVGEHEFVAPSAEHIAADDVVVTLRASDVIVATELPRAISARNVISATCVDLTESEERSFATFDVGEPLVVELTSRSITELGLAIGVSAHLVFKTTSLTLTPRGVLHSQVKISSPLPCCRYRR